MTTTYPRVTFGLYGLDAKKGSAFACADVQPFSKVTDLKSDQAAGTPCASFEPDFWLLSGSYKFKQATDALVHVGIMSQSMTDASGDFAVPPVLTITFDANYSADGLTLRFSPGSGDWCDSLTVAYYDALDAVLDSTAYTPASAELSTLKAVNGFKKIVVTFNGTNRPYRYLRLTGCDFGTLISFERSSIKGATLTEDIDIIGGESRFNTLDLRLYSADAQFSILNPSGDYQYLQERQPINAYESVNGALLYLGQFYLDKWTNKGETDIEFTCIDLLGVMDGMEYMGGLWTGTAVETILEAALTPQNIAYELDASLVGASVTGWLPICTLREAVQQLAFSIGAYADCSRSNLLRIIPVKIAADETDAAAMTTLTRADIAQAGNDITLKPQVTAVQVTAHNYVSVTTSKSLYSGTLAAGSYKITWGEPIHNLSISGATIAESGVNYAILTVASPGTVTLSGQTYNDTKRVFSVETAGLSANTRPNILKVADATLITPTNGAAVAQMVYDYYQQRYLKKARLFAPAIAPGDLVLIDVLYGRQLRATTEKMVSNLTGGFTVDCEFTGVDNVA